MIIITPAPEEKDCGFGYKRTQTYQVGCNRKSNKMVIINNCRDAFIDHLRGACRHLLSIIISSFLRNQGNVLFILALILKQHPLLAFAGFSWLCSTLTLESSASCVST